MRVLVGIDDTDNQESRGTGFRVRDLGTVLADTGLAIVGGITRHQLLVDPRIRYTKHNSSACLAIETSGYSPDPLDQLADFCRGYLLRESAAGSDAGLCVAPWDAAGSSVQEFGRLAKIEVVDRETALKLARDQRILLEGLTGDGGGVIGALAAVGLRATGNDGRYIWVAGVRELTGIHTAGELYQTTGIEDVRTLDGRRVSDSGKIDVGSWTRPVLMEGRAVLLVEEASNEAFEWRSVARESIGHY